MKQRNSGRLWLGGSLTLLLVACTQPQMQAPDPYANGADYPWEYTAPAGKLSTLSLTPGENNLYFEPILAARNGWGPIEIDRSNGEQRPGDGRPLTLGGKTYARGFGTHAASELRYNLKGTGAVCTRFTADIGVDDEVGNRGSVVFQVYLDGVKAYDSGVMTGASATKHVAVDLKGQQELRLVVTDAGNGKNYDHADWAIPRVYCEAPRTPNITLAPDSLSIFHKHSATVKATFRNLYGPVNLRLEVQPGRTTGLELWTTSVDLPNSGETPVTRDIVIAAPELPNIQDGDDPLTATYFLVASVDGRDVASTPLTITEKLLQIQSSLEPATLSGRPGETRRLTLTVKVTPPLDGPFPIDLNCAPNVSCDETSFTLTPVGSASGDGGTMRRDFNFTLNPDLPEGVDSLQQDFYVFVDDFQGYRTPFYGQARSVTWNVVR
ncbi:NPCBM/NEW2 domain-containing protein [Deinococcus apachensis]|uniref:NPCBM/NEW2 domain-containing protein n=1 Tax=Deinococcus apachensis TaxID=309886 RepID=UPI000376B8BD|nr:NPCBM/NEW2 domain-containing protein [Deinococcus apachensis]